MFKEFKEFAMRGNVLDMAVGIIIGAAFGKIVSSFVADVLMPPIGLLLGKVDFSNLFVNLLRHVSQHGNRFLDRGFRHFPVDQTGQPLHGEEGGSAGGPDHQRVPALLVADPDQGHALRALHLGHQVAVN